MKRRWREGSVTHPVFVSYKHDAIAVLIALAVYVLFIWKLHEVLIGVAPIVMG
jgi:hypothetical protein